MSATPAGVMPPSQAVVIPRAVMSRRKEGLACQVQHPPPPPATPSLSSPYLGFPPSLLQMPTGGGGLHPFA